MITVHTSAGKSKWTEVCILISKDSDPEDKTVIVSAKFLDPKEAKLYAESLASRVANHVLVR